jgi:hypothetical protein
MLNCEGPSPILRYYPRMCLRVLRKTMNSLVGIAGLQVNNQTQDLPDILFSETVFHILLYISQNENKVEPFCKHLQ